MLKQAMYLFVFGFLIGIAGIGCHSHDEADHEDGHEHEGTSVTLWTEKTELFMEYPPLVVGEQAAFAVHLSDLSDFKPVTRGQLTCLFTQDDGEQVTVVADAPSHPGIFRPVMTFSEAGEYDMELHLEGSQVSDVIRVADVRVYDNETQIPHAEETASGEELITFLKEQQWKIDFRTEPVKSHELSASVGAVGEILPKHSMHAQVPAPVNGVILADQNERIPNIGSRVSKDQVLAVISPPANTETSLNAVRVEYLLAKAEYERARRLFDKEAIPQKRLEEARLKYESQKAGFDVIAQQVDFGTLANDDGVAALHFHLKSPIDGIVEDIHFHVGESVAPGQKLFTITNPGQVLLKANVPVGRIAQIKQTGDASFEVEGYEQAFRVSDLNGKLISIGSLVDDKSRTVPVIFEVDNPDNLLKIGMFAEVRVKTSETVEALAIPNTAIFDDNGTPVAYVHIAGESFAKRVLETGITDRGYTQVLSGVSAGERVVTAGGYQVRLASLSTSVPTGHGHEH